MPIQSCTGGQKRWSAKSQELALVYTEALPAGFKFNGHGKSLFMAVKLWEAEGKAETICDDDVSKGLGGILDITIRERGAFGEKYFSIDSSAKGVKTEYQNLGFRISSEGDVVYLSYDEKLKSHVRSIWREQYARALKRKREPLPLREDPLIQVFWGL